MKKYCIRLVERLRYTWRSLVRAASRNHDPFRYTAWLRLISAADGGNPSEGSDPKYMTANQPSFSSTSDSPYEIIYRSESGSGRSRSLCSLEHRRHRARAERTWNRRAEPDEPARIREFFIRAQRKRREPTSRPILTKGDGDHDGICLASKAQH